jgi:hypothetical protein
VNRTSSRRNTFALFGALWVGCGGPARPAPSTVDRTEGAPACETDQSQLKVMLHPGQAMHTPVGVDVTFVGSGHDDFDDGRFDDWVSLRFQIGDEVIERMVSVHAPRRASELPTVCWQLGAATKDGIEIIFMPKAGTAP